MTNPSLPRRTGPAAAARGLAIPGDCTGPAATPRPLRDREATGREPATSGVTGRTWPSALNWAIGGIAGRVFAATQDEQAEPHVFRLLSGGGEIRTLDPPVTDN